MKKITISIVMALLCLFFEVRAQVSVPVQSLHIGDQVPDITIDNLLNYPKQSAKLSDFRGKLVILDFWATWCAPCVTMIPKMDALQKKFADQVQFIAVTYQSLKEVQAFEASYQKQQKVKLAITEAVSDTALHKLFPHATIPHYVWIDGSGRLVAITEFDQVNEANITKTLAERQVAVTQKKAQTTIPYDFNKPLLINNNGGTGDNLLYHSVLTSYTPGLNSGYIFQTDTVTGRKITCKNLSIHMLFELAYSDSGRNFNTANTRYAVKDTSRIINLKDYGQKYRDWLNEGNGFCYELKVPRALMRSTLHMMRTDVDRLFPMYQAKIVKVERSCLVLERINTKEQNFSTQGEKPDIIIDKFGWKAVNVTVGLLVERLNFFQVMNTPILDETGLQNPVDLTILLNTPKPDIAALNQELATKNLRLAAVKRVFEELIISDRN
jgi:thiol-disulfide isomerase/thioredoxin